LFFLFLFNHATMLRKEFGFGVSVHQIIELFYQAVFNSIFQKTKKGKESKFFTPFSKT
jgi:hypothetical protein